MPKLHLPLPAFKILRLILPFAVLLSGTTIFLCAMSRTYHIDTVLTRNIHEERYLMSRNDRMEWWAGLTVMGNGVFAMFAVFIDKTLPFKLSVFTSSCCLVLLFYAVMLDAGEFSELSKLKSVKGFLEDNAHKCKTESRNMTFGLTTYSIHDCECTKDGVFALDFYAPYSCEILDSLYYVHAVLSFALCCALSFTLFVIFSFVLILKRISQITTALHLDEKPLSEDFSNISGDLYVDT